MARPKRVYDPFTGLERKPKAPPEAWTNADYFKPEPELSRDLGVTQRRARGILSGRESIKGRRIA